ncbi:MAG: methyltransferase [Rhodoglobus sp.]
MSETALTGQTWVAFGPNGAVGSIHRTTDGFTFKVLGDASPRGTFGALDAAKGALHAALPAGSDWPEFREH